MFDNDIMLKTRTEYIDLIKKELLGPGSEISIPDEEHELISDMPNVRYYVGVLFTQDNKILEDGEEKSDISVEEGDNVFQENSENEETTGEENLSESKKSDYKSAVEENSVSDVDGDKQDNLDDEVLLATQNMPSSMGITFFVKGNSEKVKCRIKFATYRKATSTDCRVPLSDECIEKMSLPDQLKKYVEIDRDEKTLRLKQGGFDNKTVNSLKERDILDSDEYSIFDKLYKLANQLSRGYVRIPHELEVCLNFNGRNYIDENTGLDKTHLKVTALRRNIRDNVYSVTIMLVNDSNAKVKPELCFFQPVIRVSSHDNEFCFVDYTGEEDFDTLDEEAKLLSLQYRNKKIYATGLGTSTGWKVNKDGEGDIYSDFFPAYEVPSMEFKIDAKYAVPDKTFSMKYLSDLMEDDKSSKIKHLEELVSAYKKWIKIGEDDINSLDAKYHEISHKTIAGCFDSAKRMECGLSILKENKNAWVAFQLANRAMFMQRAHIKLQAKTSDMVRFPYDEELSQILDSINYNNVEELLPDTYAWRPFQLAFLLMSIDSIVNDCSVDRDLVDLIWFPTGGGKTEAYLGLTAFTIFYRRLAHKEKADGTTVIMRYTLRLLAAQQFTRASTLICACEYIRHDAISTRPKYGKKYDLGKSVISIGLWIGGEHTPNDNKKAKECLKALQEASNIDLKSKSERFNKFQVLKCPWCGTSLVKDNSNKNSTWGYRLRNNKCFEIYCPQESCFFNSEGKLPIQVVDEELYDNPPTLLFGTVDKFAMLPWNEKIGKFLAVRSKNRTPELIIQDELHLISGPLGTMVGLYESAIDMLCTKDGIKPKVIASTATIRRAVEQCASLYNRDVRQFPHPGINADDSFFAREAKVDYSKEAFGRMYVGIMPSGKSKVMMENKSIAALLQKINVMDIPDEVKDKYWTLTVYFNSLKELGKCSTLVDDNVKEFIARMAIHSGDLSRRRMISKAHELTSRISTTQLNETLDKLEKTCYSKENMEKKRWPINVLLATNMISVGIDVARLNVMLMVGQPKLTSEYIQASSRIGRQYPGVSFVMYDSSKSRDRSHYEQFKGYHSSFYRYVEPTGVTPFSLPARKRALHAVVIGLLRHIVPTLSEEKMAGNFGRNKFRTEIDEIISYIKQRYKNITERVANQEEPDMERIQEEIDDILRNWENLSQTSSESPLAYGKRFLVKGPEIGEQRLLKVYNTARTDPAFDTMTSMRTVDSMVASSIIIWENEENEN